ncbi:hypothetical protein KSW81_004056 [Nannochloris sp. 'desiccata']|nr:hypothetical protein KSW81_004056 [Chlorella desiccata (nom. nud.)]
MNATDKDLNVQKVLKTTEKNFPSTSKALGNVDRAFDNTKRMKTSYDADSRVLMSVTFKCARSGCHESSGEAKQRRSKKVGCNYELVCTIRRDQPDVVHYEERHGHSGHVPGSTEDLKYLSLHPDIVKLAKEYYINAGMSPQQILYALQANGKVNAITDGKVSRHFLPSLKDIQNIVKQLKVEKQFHPNDLTALNMLVETLETKLPGTVLLYTPQVLDQDKNITNNFTLILSSPFATRMLKCFGGDMIFLDAVYGLSAYGYPILTALVRDDYGNGCPVAFCIADGEEATICSTFLSTIAAAAEMEISHVMMDKSKSQIASCKQLGKWRCLKDSTFFTQLEGSEPDEKLYACKLFSDEARSAIISGWDGGCSCNCYEIGGICAHVMAAAALESIDFSPDLIEEDIPENIDVHLRKRIGVLHGSDPLNGVECAQAELDSVKAVASVQREYSVPKENREGMQACNKLKNVLKELPGPDASYLTAEINNLFEKAKSRRPSLAPTTKAMDKKETKKLSRMPKDRVTRPLYPGRSKSKREDANTVEAPAVALDHAVSVAGAAMLQPSQDPGMEDNGVSPPALVRRNDIGRPREQKRGMENEGLVRHGKAGGLRTPRKRRYKKDDNEVF